MAVKLDDKAVLELPKPAKGAKIYYDELVPGFGCRVTAAGARSFVLNYRTAGRERRFTIGPVAIGRASSGWKTQAARAEANRIKARIKDRLAGGYDPLGELDQGKAARREEAALATVGVLCDRFEALHLPKLREATRRDYKSILRLYIRPELGELKVRDVAAAHAERLHREVGKTAKIRANRVLAVGQKLFSFALKTPVTDAKDDTTPMRTDGNPFKGAVERNPEEKRRRYLKTAEVEALLKALDEYEDQQAANVIRLLILTGCRKGELLASTWSQFDLASGVWTKPSHATKQKTEHSVPLSAEAKDLLVKIWADVVKAAKEKGEEIPNDGYVFPGRNKGQPHRIEIKNAWKEICIAAGIVKAIPGKNAKGEDIVVLKPTARVHDLRHTYASLLVSNGLSLPIIGALLGHTQAQTTQRYAHLMDDPLRSATQGVADLVMDKAKSKSGGDL